MAMNIQHVDKKDKFRALLTDMLNGDVPVIFSNDGLYINLYNQNNSKKTTSEIIKSIYNKLLCGLSQSSPYKYNISKDILTLRNLSLMHPRAQLNFCDFYSEYSNLITYFCTKSQASIRAPYKVSNSLFLKGGGAYSPYKDIDIDTVKDELFKRHTSSFFAYKSHNRFYKFFKSDRYFYLEKKFSSMRMLDVANCFDSIYTHVIAWATKHKEFNKKNTGFLNQFATTFDQLMQRSNNNETNGIPIGSEVSRIFAEIIFQQIDFNVIQILSEKHSHRFGCDYHFVRYVDDYVVFSNTTDVMDVVSYIISDELSKYNLYINDSKIDNYDRPFVTKKSNVIAEADDCLTTLYKSCFKRQDDKNSFKFQPKKINSRSGFIKKFITNIKVVCKNQNASYGDVSSFLVSCLSRQLISFVNSKEITDDFSQSDDEQVSLIRSQCKNIIFSFIEIMLFFYFVCPQSQSSNKLAKTVIIIDRFLSENYSEYIDDFRGMVMHEITTHFPLNGLKNKNRDGLSTLENLNIILAVSEFGENYLIPQEKLSKFYDNCKNITYFEVVSVLYYIKDHTFYYDLKEKIKKSIFKIISKNQKLLHSCSEANHLFLDSMSCPYLSREFKKELLMLYLKQYEQKPHFSYKKIEGFIDDLQSIYWFVKWKDLDLVKLLERKELNLSY